MAEDKGTTDTVDADDAEDVDTTDTGTTDTDKPDDKPDTVSRAELDKAIATRDKVKRELREIREKLKATDTKDKAEPTEADKLRAALVRTAGVSALVTGGVTDKADQDAILSMLKVDGLDVSEDGTVDTDSLTDTLDTLRRIFTPKDSGKARPPRVDTKRGQSDSGSGVDSDTLRYRKLLGRA